MVPSSTVAGFSPNTVITGAVVSITLTVNVSVVEVLSNESLAVTVKLWEVAVW